MNLEQLVDKIQEIALNSPVVNSFVFDDTEAVDEAHNTDYPLLLQTAIEDVMNIRSNRQTYNIEFFLLDTYYQNDPKSLRQKYSSLEQEGILVIKELIEEDGIASNGEITINRSIDNYNDSLCLVKFNFSVDIINCNDLLKQPTGLRATYASNTSLELTWSDRSVSEDSFQIYRSEDNITFTLIATVAADSESYTDSGLTEDSSYYYKIKALSSTNRSAFSPVAEGSTVTPIIL